MRKKSLQVALLFVCGLGLGAGLAYANHPWLCSGSTAYHWARRTVGVASPVRQTRVRRNANDYISSFNGSTSLWNTTVINLVGGSSLRLYYGAYGNNGWLGLATIFPSGCVIGSATSKVNDTYMRDTTTYDLTSVAHVTCQEVGHTFGLGHNENDFDTCMNDLILTAGNTINQHDYDQLSSIYANIPN